MIISEGYSRIRKRIFEAIEIIAVSKEVEWSIADRNNWTKVLNDIEVNLSSNMEREGFSIIRSLDANNKTDGQISQAILKVAQELQDSGFNNYR